MAGELGALVVSLEANIARFEQGMKAAADLTQKTMGSITSASEVAKYALGGLAGALSIGAMVQAVRGAMDLADATGKAAQKAGIAVESYSRLSYAAAMADVSNEQLGKALKEVNKHLSDAAAGSRDSGELFRTLGVSVLDLEGNIRAGDEALLDLADRFAAMPETADKVNMAIRVFGQKIGPELLPYLNQGRAGITALGEELARMGGVMSAETAREAERFNDNMRALEQSSKGLSISLGNELAPRLANITSAMREAAKDSGVLYSLWVGMGGVAANLFGGSGDSARELRGQIEDVKKEIERLEGMKEQARGTNIFGPYSMKQLQDAKDLLADMEAKLKAMTEAPKPKSDNSVAALEASKFLDKYKSEAARMKVELDQLETYRKQGVISETQYRATVAAIREKYGREAAEKEKQRLEQEAKSYAEAADAQTKEYEDSLREIARIQDAALRERQALEKKDADGWLAYLNAKEDAYIAAGQQANRERLKRNAEEKKMWDGMLATLEGGFRDSFMRMLEGGKGWWKSFTEGLKNTFKTTVADAIYQMFAKPLFLNVVAQIAQAVPGLGNLAQSALGMAGQGAGGFSPLAALGIDPATMGMAAAVAAISAGVSGAIGRSMGFGERGVRAAQVGGALLGVLPGVLIGRITDPDGLAQRTAQFGTAPDSNYSYSATSAFGTFGTFADKWFSDKEMGADIRKFLEGLATFEDGLAKMLTPEQIDKVKQRLAGANKEYGFGQEHSDFASVFGNITQDRVRTIAEALGDSTLSGLVASFKGTGDELASFVTSYLSFTAALGNGGDALAAGLRQYQDSLDPITAAMRNNRAQLDTVMSGFKSDASSINALVQAQSAYYLANVNLIAQLSELKRKLGDMFDQTARGIRMAGLSNADQYAFLQSESDTLYQQLQGATSVSEIERLANLLNANYSAAFGLLSPEEQAAQRQLFLESIDRINKETQERLAQRQQEIADEARKANDELRALLDKAAGSQQQAADTQLEAANTFSNAVNNGIVVRVTDDRPATVEAGG